VAAATYSRCDAPRAGPGRRRGRSRQFAAGAQASPTEPDAQGNQKEAEHKNTGEDQKDQKANIWMRRPGRKMS